MTEPLFWHRLQFAFTIIYHYLFPAAHDGAGAADRRAEDRARSAAATAAMERRRAVLDPDLRHQLRRRRRHRHPDGVPVRDQLGGFSQYAGGVIGHTLAMEGMFAFFLESAFLGLLVFGEQRLGPRGHSRGRGRALRRQLALGLLHHLHERVHAASGWLRGRSTEGRCSWRISGRSSSTRGRSSQYAHTMVAAVVTASFVVAAVGAFYALQRVHVDHARRFPARRRHRGLIASVLVAFPTGDRQAKLVARHQPVSAGRDGRAFESGRMAGIVLIGQPNLREQRLDNPIVCRASSAFWPTARFTQRSQGSTTFLPRRGRTTSSFSTTRSTSWRGSGRCSSA